MKNKKGFTLIELLAVIVILAIIALITVPIILNTIKTAKKNSAKASAYGYIDAINYSNSLYSMKEDYTDLDYKKINDGNNINVTTINNDIKMKGKKPTKGKITVVKGKVTSAKNLCFDGYAVNYDGKTATINSNANCLPVPAPNSFSTDSWETIAENTTSSVYQVGDEKTITMDVNGDNEDETYHIMVVNKSACTNGETSESACGLVLQFKELIKANYDDRRFNNSNTNVGGWPGSKLYTYLNSTLYNKLPSDLKSVIIETITISGHGGTSGETNFTSNDKLYLLSIKEVGNSDDDTASSETRKLDYYDSGTGTAANAKRVKYNYGTTTANYWWLRTPFTTVTSHFIEVYPNGSGGNSLASNPSGLAPAFRVG